MNELIDFDEASHEWRKNKILLGNGYFAYKCCYIHSNGKQCNKVVAKQKMQPLYRIREDWTPTVSHNSLLYCIRHIRRGPVKELTK